MRRSRDQAGECTPDMRGRRTFVIYPTPNVGGGSVVHAAPDTWGGRVAYATPQSIVHAIQDTWGGGSLYTLHRSWGGVNCSCHTGYLNSTPDAWSRGSHWHRGGGSTRLGFIVCATPGGGQLFMPHQRPFTCSISAKPLMLFCPTKPQTSRNFIFCTIPLPNPLNRALAWSESLKERREKTTLIIRTRDHDGIQTRTLCQREGRAPFPYYVITWHSDTRGEGWSWGHLVSGACGVWWVQDQGGFWGQGGPGSGGSGVRRGLGHGDPGWGCTMMTMMMTLHDSIRPSRLTAALGLKNMKWRPHVPVKEKEFALEQEFLDKNEHWKRSDQRESHFFLQTQPIVAKWVETTNDDTNKTRQKHPTKRCLCKKLKWTRQTHLTKEEDSEEANNQGGLPRTNNHTTWVATKRHTHKTKQKHPTEGNGHQSTLKTSEADALFPITKQKEGNHTIPTLQLCFWNRRSQCIAAQIDPPPRSSWRAWRWVGRRFVSSNNRGKLRTQNNFITHAILSYNNTSLKVFFPKSPAPKVKRTCTIKRTDFLQGVCARNSQLFFSHQFVDISSCVDFFFFLQPGADLIDICECSYEGSFARSTNFFVFCEWVDFTQIPRFRSVANALSNPLTNVQEIGLDLNLQTLANPS